MENQDNKQSTAGDKRVIFDAKGKVLGRLATAAASLLMGKNVVGKRKNQLLDIKVVIFNTDLVALTGKKEDAKTYVRYSGYHGGIKAINVAEQRKRDSRKIVQEAVFGMLPKNKMRARMMNNLLLFKGNKHPYQINND